MAAGDFSDRDGLIWMDGEIIPWRDAKVHVLTHGLHYASSVFEGERAYDDNIFRMHDHSKRLIRSAELIDMQMTLTAEELDTAKREILEANKLTNAYIRQRATRYFCTSHKNTCRHRLLGLAELFLPRSARERHIATNL